MKNIQFLDSCGKIHEYNFIRVVLPDEKISVYSDTGYVKYATNEIEEYYKAKKINVIAAKSYEHVKNRYIKTALNLLSGIRIVIKSRKEKYDYCFVHYLSTRRAILSTFIPKRTKQVLITYGSDILRRKNFNNFFFRNMINRSSLIVFNSGNLRYTFEKAYGKKYAEKCIDIAFPCASFKRLDDVIRSNSVEDAKKHFSLPLDKTIVVCGHTATEDEQYEKMIDALCNINPKILKECYFVFFMTYGSGEYITYREKIERKLAKTNLSFTVLKDYLTYENMSLLHMTSDIHITSITTDALSLFLLEEMYAGSTVLYGNWLHYLEFENDKYRATSFNSFEELPKVFEDTFMSISKDDMEIIKDKIERLNSNDTIAAQWKDVFKRL